MNVPSSPDGGSAPAPPSRAPREDLAAAYRYCAEFTREAGTSFAWAFACLPSRARRAIRTVYAFSRTLDDAADGPGKPAEKQARLRELRVALDGAYGDAAVDPLFLALADVAATFAIPRTLFESMIAGVEMDLSVRRYETYEELRGYAYRVASVVGLVCLRIFGCRDPRAEEPAVELGYAMQLTNILRDVREDLERDRLYLPAEDLRRFGVTEADLSRGIVDERFRALMRFEVERAREHFRRSLPLRPLVPRRSRPCPEAIRGVYGALLCRIERRDYDVFSGRVALGLGRRLAVLVAALARGALS